MDADAISHVARLARLEVSAEEAVRLAADVDALLESAAVLRELSGDAGDDGGEPRTLPPAPAEPDALHMPPSYIAPEWRDGFFTVPRP